MAVGIPPDRKLFPLDVTTAMPERKRHGRPPEHPVPDEASVPAASLFANPPDAAFRTLSWRTGTKGKGPLQAAFGARRMKVADGPVTARGQHLPGEEVWLVCEHRATGERKHHLTNHPPEATLGELAAALEARRACERAHQRLKDELGLDHYEGREAPPEARPAKAGPWSRRGLHHRAPLCLIALAFLRAMRLGGKTGPPPPEASRQPGPDRAAPGPPPKPTLPRCDAASPPPCSATSVDVPTAGIAHSGTG